MEILMKLNLPLITPFILAASLTAGCSSAPKNDTANFDGTPVQTFKRIDQRKGNFQFNDKGEVVCEHRDLKSFPKSKPAVPTCDSLGIKEPRRIVF